MSNESTGQKRKHPPCLRTTREAARTNARVLICFIGGDTAVLSLGFLLNPSHCALSLHCQTT